MEFQNVKCKKNFKIQFGTAMHQGGMRTQQDRLINLEINGNICFGVFDGHGRLGDRGQQWAQACIDLLPVFITARSSEFSENPRGVISEFAETANRDIAELHPTGGTTMTLVFFMKNEILCANLGDSDAFLFSQTGDLIIGSTGLPDSHLEGDGRCLKLTSDHSPQNPSEQGSLKERNVAPFYATEEGGITPFFSETGEQNSPQKIHFNKNMKGDLATYVVDLSNHNNKLAMTRSLGDGNLSSCQPSFSSYSFDDITPGWKALIIATDGLHDNFCNIQSSPDSTIPGLYDFVMYKSCLDALSKENGAQDVATSLRDRNEFYAFRNFKHQRDNTAIIVVYFRMD